MAEATPSPSPRLGIGQILVRLLYEFRAEMLTAAVDNGFDDLRPPHLHILANLRVKGIRLTDLAQRSGLSLGTTSVFVSELETLGYLRRQPDPDDGRAKRILPTARGMDLWNAAGQHLTAIEARWAALVGRDEYGQARTVLQHLLDEIIEADPADQIPRLGP